MRDLLGSVSVHTHTHTRTLSLSLSLSLSHTHTLVFFRLLFGSPNQKWPEVYGYSSFQDNVCPNETVSETQCAIKGVFTLVMTSAFTDVDGNFS